MYNTISLIMNVTDKSKGIHFFKNSGLQELIIHQINSSEKE